jgi:crotonobetainyl-CoA:carnitine CoA-transferase CaiB-like acyl-CoA transferase
MAMQPMTRGMRVHLTDDPVTRIAYPNGELGPRPWNAWGIQIAMYRNKKSVTLDYLQPDGLEYLRRLVAASDIVTENNSIGLLEKFGITREWLFAANPNLIYLRMPAFGLEGEYARARALGWHVEAIAGHTLQRGYEDHDASANHNIYAADFMAGLNLANAALIALRHRRRTGQGQVLEIVQMDGTLPFIAHALMDYTLNRRLHEARGNRDINERYPCGVYPAQSPGPATDGDDRWIAIHIQSDEEWRELRAAMGSPEWAMDPRFDTNAGRKQFAEEIDREIATWTAERDDYEMMHLLQGRGIAAMPVLEASRLLDEPHLRARGFLRQQLVDGRLPYIFPGPLYNFSETPLDFYQDPVMLGEHNEYVYREIIGISPDEFEGLQASGQIGMAFDASVP